MSWPRVTGRVRFVCVGHPRHSDTAEVLAIGSGRWEGFVMISFDRPDSRFGTCWCQPMHLEPVEPAAKMAWLQEGAWI